MQFARRIVLAACIGFCCCPANARGQDPVDAWEEAQSLRELPAGIQALLGVGLGAAGGIADRGDRFNTSDVVGDNLPMRRFALGILHGDTAVVVLEQGGRGYSVRTVEFRQVGMTWEAVRCAALLDVPRRGAELLQALAAHPLDANLPCRGRDAPLAPAAASAPATAADVAPPSASPSAAPSVTPAAHPHVRLRPGA